MANMPRKFNSYPVFTPETLEDLDGYFLFQPNEVGAELVRIKASDLFALFLELSQTP